MNFRNKGDFSAGQRAAFWILVLIVIVLAFFVFSRRSKKETPARTAVERLPRVGAASLYPPVDSPGAIDDRVTQEDVQDTICVPGYTSKVRPPRSFMNKLKRQLMQQNHLPGEERDYELDHIIPLELGGCPSCLTNLWMEPWVFPGAHEKDLVEDYLHREVCKGHIKLADAQQMIIHDWYAVYLTYRTPEPQQ